MLLTVDAFYKADRIALLCTVLQVTFFKAVLSGKIKNKKGYLNSKYLHRNDLKKVQFFLLRFEF